MGGCFYDFAVGQVFMVGERGHFSVVGCVVVPEDQASITPHVVEPVGDPFHIAVLHGNVFEESGF